MYQDVQEKRRIPQPSSLAERNKGGVIREGNGRGKDTRGYAPVNGLKMYYEIEGSGNPLVFIPPAFGFAGLKPFPSLVQNHSVITVDLQGNGRTADIPDRPISIEQYAKDVVGLLNYLGIAKADFFGESYGADAAAIIALRYPEMVGRVVTYAATFGPAQDALNPETTSSSIRLRPIPATSSFREKTTGGLRPIQITGPGFMTRLATFSGPAFRNKSWLPSRPRCLSFLEITISCESSMPLRP